MYPTSWPEDTPIQDSEDLNTINFKIELVDIHTVPQETTIQCTPGSLSPCFNLAHHGYIGNAPNNPTVAVSIKTLELYRRLRRRKPGFSIEAFVKVICDIYMVHWLILHWSTHMYELISQIPYRCQYHTVLGDTFHVYLSIHQHVDKWVRCALGHESSNWQVLNACLPCTYKVCLYNYLMSCS